MVWIVGAVLFILVLGMTFTDVYGFNIPNSKPNPDQTRISQQQPGQNNHSDRDEYQRNDNPLPDPPDGTPIPEPATILLLAGGLGLGYLKSLRKNKK